MSNDELIHNILSKYWGYPEFRAPQADIIKSVLAGHDTLGLMPTGGGKSITFQVPTLAMDGIFYVRAWLNEGELAVGDDIMFVLVGGDIRPHVIDALQHLVGRLKSECVSEVEQSAV